jgi:hypothetical protein
MVFKTPPTRQSTFLTSENAVNYAIRVTTQSAPRFSSPTQDLTNYSLAGGNSVSVTKQADANNSALVVTVRVAYATSATAGVRVVWLYSPDGTNYDSVNDAVAQGNYYDMSFAAGGTAQATLLIPLLVPYVQILIINKDSSNAATVNLWTLFIT